MRIERASEEDWPRVRDIRLRMLRGEPDAFGSRYEDEAPGGEDTWRSWVTGWEGARDQALFVAADDEAWAGTALGVRWAGEPDAVHIYAMWVEPEARRRGVGRALVEAAVEWARDLGAGRVVLGVAEGNTAAASLYRSCGFVATGAAVPLREGSDREEKVLQRPL